MATEPMSDDDAMAAEWAAALAESKPSSSDDGMSSTLTETVAPNLSSYDQNVVNASLGVTNRPHQVEVMLWARNLTKDDSLISAFPTVAQDGSYSGYPNAPRTYGVTVRKSF